MIGKVSIMKHVSPEGVAVPLSFQASMIAATLIVFFGITYTRIQLYRPYSPILHVENFTPKILRQYGGGQNVVKVGLYITEFAEFDFIPNKFNMRGTVWFECDAATVSVETLEKFTFLKGDFTEKNRTGMRLEGGKLFVRYNVRLSLTTPTDFREFPYEDNLVQIMLANTAVLPSEIIFESSEREFVIKADLEHFGWDVMHTNVYPGFIQEDLDPHDPKKVTIFPVVKFVMGCRALSVRNIMTIVLPLILIFFVATMGFSFDPEKYMASVINSSVTSVAAILAYRFVIQNISPSVGYSMISDYFFIVTLLLAIANFFLVLALAHRPLWLKKVAIAAMHVCVMITTVVTVLVI